MSGVVSVIVALGAAGRFRRNFKYRPPLGAVHLSCTRPAHRRSRNATGTGVCDVIRARKWYPLLLYERERER